jgi:hypothetical protein
VPFEQASAAVQSLYDQIRKGRMTDDLVEKLLALVKK